MLSALRRRLADRLVFSRVRSRLGGRLRFAICGGAPLSEDLGVFFRRLGILILEGYGLTETCAPVTLNTPRAIRFGTVGKPLADVTIRFTSEGEIEIRSQKVFLGYWRDPEATAQALSAGWLRTGDLGKLDSDGFLQITGRKKDLIITSGGKNIAPQKIEALAQAAPCFEHVLVAGDRRPFLVALVWPSDGATESQIAVAMEALNARLPSYESLKRWKTVHAPLSIENGDLTPSLKLRRREVTERFQAEIDRLYS
jgi:long-chain acyl-CoA synthetase